MKRVSIPRSQLEEDVRENRCHQEPPGRTSRHPSPFPTLLSPNTPSTATMSLPVVFFDVSIGGNAAGRIEMTVSKRVDRSTRESSSAIQ